MTAVAGSPTDEMARPFLPITKRQFGEGGGHRGRAAPSIDGRPTARPSRRRAGCKKNVAEGPPSVTHRPAHPGLTDPKSDRSGFPEPIAVNERSGPMSTLTAFVLRILINAMAIWIAVRLIPQIRFPAAESFPTGDWWKLIV